MIFVDRDNDVQRSESGIDLTQRLNTAYDINTALNQINKSAIEHHFVHTNKPYVLCSNVPEKEWLLFAETDDENNTFQLRFLDFFLNKVSIIDMPSVEHETTVSVFRRTFLAACGDTREFRDPSSVILYHLEPDWSCGPRHPSLPIPRGLEKLCHWRTFILEVGMCQNMLMLQRKAAKWAEVPGVCYVLCIQVERDCCSFSYKFFEIVNNALVQLNEAHDIRPGNNQPLHISMDTKKLLGLGPNNNVPQGVLDPLVINMCEIFDQAYEDVTN